MPRSWRDPLCLLLVSAICSAAYVLGRGLYSDDWFFVLPLATSVDQSWAVLYRTLAETPFVGSGRCKSSGTSPSTGWRPATSRWFISPTTRCSRARR